MLLDLVKSRRPDGFGLWVFASNAPARAFYLRHGLIELETTDGRDNQEHAPDVRMVWPGTDPRRYLREQIDVLDEDLAQLLARRFALTAAVQGYKPRGGHVDRDPQREREIAERMAHHVPGLEVERVARVLDVIITEGIDRWEAARSSSPGDDA
jgi:chorismate mutase